MSRPRRSSKIIRQEVRAFCKSPRFLSDIIRTLNLNSKMIRKAIDDGVIEKIGEKSSGRGGPKAHVYQAVNDDG